MKRSSISDRTRHTGKRYVQDPHEITCSKGCQINCAQQRTVARFVSNIAIVGKDEKCRNMEEVAASKTCQVKWVDVKMTLRLFGKTSCKSLEFVPIKSNGCQRISTNLLEADFKIYLF